MHPLGRSLRLSATSLSGLGSAFCQPFPSLSGADSFLVNEPAGRAGEGMRGDPCGILAHSPGFTLRPPAQSASSGKAGRPWVLDPSSWASTASSALLTPPGALSFILPTSARRIFRRENRASYRRFSSWLISTWHRHGGTLRRPRASYSPACVSLHTLPCCPLPCHAASCPSGSTPPTHHAVPGGTSGPLGSHGFLQLTGQRTNV